MKTVYQMAFDINGLDPFGLVFSNELETYNSPIFTIPIDNKIETFGSYKFPGELGGNYKDFKLSILKNGKFSINTRFQEMPFKMPEFDLRFSLYYDDRVTNFFRNGFFYEKKWPYDEFYSIYRYLGQNSEFLKEDKLFAIIVPEDILIMDYMYKEFGISFIGKTPIFNKKNKSG